ncbi:hypothetical protein SLEP1_g47836 [Rubroshorea leprosula]|uniref:CCHC-type domain-containing protein n=1 Tax=Rubroshorea leprosula TaxID=152421 RepID=A0AAV5LSN2_9ROSI|nr:hypothetical protein SLEP1_g47836 [Rubroshorea leprosula]
MSIAFNPCSSSQETDLLTRSVKRIKGDENHSIVEDFLMQEPMERPISYKDMVSAQEPTSIICDSSSRDDFLEEDSDMEDDGSIPTILISKEEKRRITSPWLNSIIIKAFGTDRAGYNFILPRIKAQWKPKAKMDCIDLGLDFFLIRFQDRDDLNKVLHRGPRFVGPYFLTIRKWEPAFNPEKATFKTTAIWARLPRLPIEYYDFKILERIGKMLGTPLRIDAHTAHQSRGQYARICIQVDLDEPLVPCVRIGNHIQKVLYEGPVSLCFSCGCVGHKENHCPLQFSEINPPNEETAINSQLPSESENVQDIGITESQSFGPWMLVERKRSKKKPSTSFKAGQSNISMEKQSNHPQANSVSGPSGLRVGSRAHISKGSVRVDSALNETTVMPNGLNPSPHQKNQQCPAPNGGPNIGKAQIPQQTQPIHKGDKVQDKISSTPTPTRGKTSFTKNSTNHNKNQTNVKSISSERSSTSNLVLDNGSNNIHHAQPYMGCLFGQQQQNPTNGGCSLTDSGKEPNSNRGLVGRGDEDMLAQTDLGKEKCGPYAISSPTSNARVDPTSATSSGPKFVHSGVGKMDLDDRDGSLGRMVRTDLTEGSFIPSGSPISTPTQDDRMHEDSAFDNPKGADLALQ